MIKTLIYNLYSNGNHCKSVSFTHTYFITIIKKSYEPKNRKTRYVILIGCYDD